MKKFIAILAFAAVSTILVGCGEEKIVQLDDELQQRDGVYVVPKNQKPYSGKFVTSYGNNVIKEAGALKNGKRDGEIKTYREDGSVDEIQTFVDGVLNGKWEKYYKNGQIEYAGNYKNKEKDEKWERYNENGKLALVEHYKDGKQDGKWEFYSQNGQLMRVEHYKDGNKDGKWEFYSQNGQLTQVEHYKDGNKDGKWENYYENGQLMQVEHYKDGNKDGKWENYYENGQLRSGVYYKDGKPDGKRELYDENGEQMLGSFSDQRDGKTYITVKIGKQTWMAENLNYSASDSKCYGNDESNCQKYGRLYDWNTAMKSCPSGWHLPSRNEYKELDEAVGGENIAGKKLKANSGWNNNGNGTDEYGFSALPGGYSISGGSFDGVGDYGSWWSSTENYANYAYGRYMNYSYSIAFRNDYYKSRLYSVRCLKD
jgi:uncharacterized protein (TIGR02145 family)